MVAVTMDPLYVRPAPRRTSHAVFVRRRIVAAVLLLSVLVALTWAVGRVTTALGDVPASVPGRSSSPHGYVVQEGDTLWGIARRLQPSGDVRGLVEELRDLNGGSAALRAGDRLLLP